MRRLSMPLLLIVLLSLPLVVCAQVYKWKDAHGTVHYSDTPPPHGVHYTSVKTTTGMAATADASSRNNTDDASDDTAAPAPRAPMANTPENRKKLCSHLQANIKLLKQDNPVITTDAEGKQHIMSKEHRSSELDKEQKQYQQFCG